MAGYIISDNNEFVGSALAIPPLKNSINTLSGNVSEYDVYSMATDLLQQYNLIFTTDKEKWREVRNIPLGMSGKYIMTTSSCRNALKRFIKRYEINFQSG